MKEKKKSGNTAKRRREQGGNTQTARILLKSLAVGLACMAVFLSVASVLSCSMDINQKLIPAVALFAAAVSAFAGGLYAAKKIGRRGLISGALSQIGLFLCLAVIASLLTRSVSLWILVPLAVIILFGALGGLTAVNTKRR